MGRPLRFVIMIGVFCSWLFVPALVFALDNVYVDSLTQGNELSAGGALTENVDPYSGNLSLVHTDIFLPGNSGLDLKIMRVYNSAIWANRNTTYPQLVPMNERSPLGIGWSMHMGIVYNPGGTGSANHNYPNNPVVEMPDGSKHILYKKDSTTFITKEFWRYKSLGGGIWELTLTDGTVYTYQFNGTAGYTTLDRIQVAQVTRIIDASGLAKIDITYSSDIYPKRIMQIKDSLNRIVQFNYNSDLFYGQCFLSSITVDNRTYSYTLTDYNTFSYLGKQKFLTQVSLPTGNPWQYSYYADNVGHTQDTQLQMLTLRYPNGGTITYTYNDVSFLTGLNAYKPSLRVVASRTIGGQGIPVGTWTYSYASGGAAGDFTWVRQSPDAYAETYVYHGWGSECPSQANNIDGGQCNNIWRIGKPKSVDISKFDGSKVKTDTYTWSASSPISTIDTVGNASWGTGTQGFVYDTSVKVPLLRNKTITRNGQPNTYKTDITSYDSYGNPLTITETGDNFRTKNLTYWYNSTKNIVRGKPATERVTGGFPGNFTTTYTYDVGGNGNLTAVKKYAPNSTNITNYTYHPAKNNLQTVRDANNNLTTYGWSYGRVATVSNPAYSPAPKVSRVINPDGTVDSETDGRGKTTYFDYDGLLRLTAVTPPAVANPTGFVYQQNYSYMNMTKTRGGFSVRYDYDGFGRLTNTSDSVGRITSTAYTSYGTKNYMTSNTGDTVYFDYFGRPTNIVHRDSTQASYGYSGSIVTITDENQKPTVFTYNAFGNPDEKLLVNVRDAKNYDTTYNYNILGSLTTITQGSVVRRFNYNPSNNFLDNEVHPDKGTISYTRYPLGNLKTKTDSLGTVYYFYDAANRLRHTDSPSGTPLVSFDYDGADNRTSMTTPTAAFGYTYDDANRLTEKTETITGNSYATSYVPNGNDYITDIYYPSNRHVVYSYNTLNQVTSVTGFGGDITNIQYCTNADGICVGLPKSYYGSNGVTTNFTYTPRNFTDNIAALPNVLNVGYDYEDRGNLKNITNNIDASKNQTFTYDDLNRLWTFSGPYGDGSFDYDRNGNRLTKTLAGFASTTYNYNPTTNRLTSTSGGDVFSFGGYNGNGDVTSYSGPSGSFSLQYNVFHNLASLNTPGGGQLAGYNYDGDGMRVTKTSGGKTLTYHYDPAGRVLTESDDVGGFNDYIYLHGKLVARVDNPFTPNVGYWAKTYGRISTYRVRNIIEQTADNGYITGGTFILDDNTPTASLVKLDNSGTIVWQKMYYSGWISGYSSTTNIVRKANDGGYIVGGGIGDVGGFANLLVLKINSDGSVVWQKQYQDINYSIYGLSPTSDGGYIVLARKSDGTVAILKLNGDGTVAWEKDYSDTSGVYGYGCYTVQQTADSGFVIAGWVGKPNINPWDNSDSATWVMKLNPSGNVEWTNAYTGLYSYAVLQQTSDGGYILGGAIESGSSDAMAMKLSASGSISWIKRYGGSGSNVINWIRQLTDGTYIAAGNHDPTGTSRDFWVLKLNDTGGITWQKSYGGTNPDQAYTIQETIDGGYVAAGDTSSFGDPNYNNLWILKLNSDGSCPPLDSNTAVSEVTVNGFSSEATTITASPVTPVVSNTNLTVADINVVVTQQAP
ncbi:MAG: hypothetical protein M1377_03570 [Deltaproteobacteria bacterium]|nr:hypothetical protein [Deltaproteobacteria bacterium]